jgi:ATP-binding cassette, subfamily B, bacterial MsbA
MVNKREKRDKSKSVENLKTVLPYIRPYYPYVLASLGITILLTLLGLLPPLVMRSLIDDVLTSGSWQLLIPLMAAHVSIPVMQGLISFGNTLVITYTGRRLVYDVRTDMYRHLMRLSMRFHGEMSSGAIMARLMGDVNAVQGLVTGQTITLATDVVVFVFAAIVTFTLNWKMALMVWAVIPLYVFNYRYFVRRIRRANIAYYRTMDRIAGNLQERLSGTHRVRSFAKEQDETEDFLADTQAGLAHAMTGTVQSVTFSTASSLIYGVGSTMLYMVGVWYALRGEMTYGSVTAFMGYTGMLFGPMLRFTQLANQFEQVMVSVDRILEIMRAEPDIVEKPDAYDLPEVKGRIEVDHLCFEYNEGEPVLNDVDIDIPAGTMVALVGHTGCGKTTITSLVMRLWDVTSGAIRIDGHDIRDVTLDSLRRQIGVVLQDPVLFNGNIADNVRYGVPDATDEQIEAACKAAEIDSLFRDLPDGYQTTLGGESGVKLSVGERQRLAIARAIIMNPGILILDEATSSLDSESERLIQKALEGVMHDRTSLVVAHRLSTIVEADIIIVMEAGKIMEMGSHTELVRAGGHYADLYNKQQGGMEDIVSTDDTEE